MGVPVTSLAADLLGWAQLVAWSLLCAVLTVLLVILSKAASLLEHTQELVPAPRGGLRAGRFLTPDRAGEPAPNTFPPRPSKPGVVALERPRAAEDLLS